MLKWIAVTYISSSYRNKKKQHVYSRDLIDYGDSKSNGNVLHNTFYCVQS